VNEPVVGFVCNFIFLAISELCTCATEISFSVSDMTSAIPPVSFLPSYSSSITLTLPLPLHPPLPPAKLLTTSTPSFPLMRPIRIILYCTVLVQELASLLRLHLPSPSRPFQPLHNPELPCLMLSDLSSLVSEARCRTRLLAIWWRRLIAVAC
jgi:hypothetical protein